MILYINSCVRADSRTERLTRALLNRLDSCNNIVEIKLAEANLSPLDRDALEARTALIRKKEYSHPMLQYARQFAEADIIVIAAPYWDLSFPAMLKTYIENIYVTGLVSKFGSDGRPEGLCRAEQLYYVTTAGGPYDRRYSYDYIKELAQRHFGIKRTQLIYAEMLDVEGYDPEQILQNEVKTLS